MTWPNVHDAKHEMLERFKKLVHARPSNLRNIDTEIRMKELDQFKAMVADLKRQRTIFKRQAQELQALQHEIGVLQERAHIDPSACKKLRRLDEVMHAGGQPLDAQILGHVAKVERCFKQLSDQLKRITPDDNEYRENSALASKPIMARQFKRAFV